MAYHIRAASRGTTPSLQICDVSACSVRMAWQPCMASGKEEDEAELDALRRDEAIAEHLRRFLRTTERYLKGELNEAPRLGAWRRV
ncbi:hypothetical protein FIU88_00905 [Halomonas sp. THAF12]|uniref:hypothetical protein n=1 Tax=Halomonas sp. THAF12 TaxID=2587849 RepID=UPI00126805A4|nr:hypothetical protein [Halomonas sp. THAF12]QFT83525.1 hypothetical protein FIU88_00905 [Halomonas sp. THAF12]